MKAINFIFAALAFVCLDLTFYALLGDIEHRPHWDEFDTFIAIVPVLLGTCVFTLLSIKKY